MSEDLNKKIKQITDILGQDNMPDNIKGLLSLLAQSVPKSEKETPKPAPIPEAKEERPVRSDFEENLEMIRKVKNVMDRLSPKDDPRINLLNAIRPFLNSQRQKSLGNCVKLLQMHNLTKYIEENDKSLF